MIDISVVDSYISQNGQFCLLDWLLEENLLPYAEYESWRYGQIDNLDKSFKSSPKELKDIVQYAAEACKKLNLVAEIQQLYRWGGSHQEQLNFSQDAVFNQAALQVWSSSKDAPQMDLFMDNTATILENSVLDGLVNRNFENAQKMLQQLSELNPSHKKLGGYQDLINYGLYICSSPTVSSESLSTEFDAVDKEVAPIAKELLGSRQRDFLAFAWRRIAASFDVLNENKSAEQQLAHSYVLLQIPDWDGLRSCLEQNSLLYQSAVLMERLTQVYSYTKQSALFVLMWGLLFERFPAEAESIFAQAGTLLLKDWDGFLECDDDWPEGYFLGYLVIQQPGLVHSIDQLPVQPGGGVQEPVNQLVVALVRARLNEENEKQYRAELKNICPAMLNCYLNKRDWQASLRKGI